MIDPIPAFNPELLPYYLLPLLYAETHYRFKYFFSYLKKREPEIIADVPHRLEAGKDLPVLLIIKDADHYPVRLTRISIANEVEEIYTEQLDRHIDGPYEDLIFILPRERLSPGSNRLSVRMSYRTGEKVRTCINDNHRGTNKAPLPIYISGTPFPKIGRCFYGEPHCHTNYTSDQVEFGASVTANKNMAMGLGLDFFAATDHSYDLDDLPDNYLRNDPGLKKWERFLDEVRQLNSRDDGFLIIPGEEVSVRNSANRNIHFLVYNFPDFIPGSGDGAERWFRWYSEKSIGEVLDLIGPAIPAFAAHPFEIPPLLQRIFINRGFWSEDDCKTSGLHGLQLLNGGIDDSVQGMIERWRRLLLQGHRLVGLAGNDAHGNFARFRQIHFPFFTMREHYYHLFGKWRTGVYLEEHEPFSMTNLLHALTSGNSFMTNGPALRFELVSGRSGSKNSISCELLSSPEFGPLERLRVFYGRTGDSEETSLIDQFYQAAEYGDRQEIPVAPDTAAGYFRCEVYTGYGKMAFSNPIWI